MANALVSTKQQVLDYLIATAPEPICADCLTAKLETRATAYVRLLMLQLSEFQRVEFGEHRCATCTGYKDCVKAVL